MDDGNSRHSHRPVAMTAASRHVDAAPLAESSFRHRWMQDTDMTDRTDSLVSVLEALREEYCDTVERTCELLRMFGSDTASFEREQAAALAQSGVGSIIDRASAGDGDVSEQEIRLFALVHREGIERACAIVSQQGVDIDEPERIWANGVRSAGAGELLGISGPARPDEYDSAP